MFFGVSKHLEKLNVKTCGKNKLTVDFDRIHLIVQV